MEAESASPPKVTKAPPGQPPWCKGMAEAAENFKHLGNNRAERERTSNFAILLLILLKNSTNR